MVAGPEVQEPETFPAPAMAAHVARPLRRTSDLPRTSLVDRLRGAGQATAIALCAPAGYGKTTVLLQWSEVDARPFAWVTVDDLDDDPAVFVRHLVDALATAEPVDDELLAAPTATEPHFSAVVLPRFAVTLRERTVPVVLVLDDLGELSSAGSLRVLGVLLAALPAGSQVACATRTAPPVPLRRLRTSQALVELGRAELAMTTQESLALVRSLGMDEHTAVAQRLVERTEGWPAGLYLATSAAVAGGSADPHAMLWGETVVEDAVADYLIDEFLARTDPVTVRFLLDSSVLTELAGPVCDAVTQTHGSAGRLHDLARSNELVVPLSGPLDRYRYHRLFGEFLRAELRRQEPERLEDLNRRASAWYRDGGEIDLAVRHARAAGDAALLGELVWHEAPRYLSAGRGATVAGWVRGLDDRQIARSRGLALTASWLATQRGDLVGFTRWLAAAEASSPDGGSGDADVSVVAAIAGHEGLRDIAQRCAGVLADGAPDRPLRALAHALRGVALALLNHTDAAMVDLERGEALARAYGMHSIRAQCLAALGGVYLATGDTARGGALVGEARRVVELNSLEHIPTLASVLAASALLHARCGRLVEAHDDAMMALRSTGLIRGFTPWFAIQCRLQLARTFLLLQDPERARVLVEEAAALHGPATESPVLHQLLQETAQLVRDVAGVPVAGPSSLTTAELRVLQFLPSHLTSPQIAHELNVSPHTVKSQCAAIYRKLAATSRRGAVTTARAMGLLPAA